MNEEIKQPLPKAYQAIHNETKDLGFTMASDILTCSLLRTLAATKPHARFLELGTGTGLATSWILDGMDKQSTLISIDNDPKCMQVASHFLGTDKRLQLVTTDGAAWIEANRQRTFDYIFADTWHGKYLLLDEVLAMLNPGALYIIDDMLSQPNWPEGHDQKAIKLLDDLEQRTDLTLVKQAWATGMVIAVKK